MHRSWPGKTVLGQQPRYRECGVMECVVESSRVSDRIAQEEVEHGPLNEQVSPQSMAPPPVDPFECQKSGASSFARSAEPKSNMREMAASASELSLEKFTADIDVESTSSIVYLECQKRKSLHKYIYELRTGARFKLSQVIHDNKEGLYASSQIFYVKTVMAALSAWWLIGLINSPHIGVQLDSTRLIEFINSMCEASSGPVPTHTDGNTTTVS
ncbi:hypothetical protein DFH06DRAFT_1308192, partial [Mycena polygramma]